MPDLESTLEACVWGMAWMRLRVDLQAAPHDNYGLSMRTVR